jgi:hypothetical protein
MSQTNDPASPQPQGNVPQVAPAPGGGQSPAVPSPPPPKGGSKKTTLVVVLASGAFVVLLGGWLLYQHLFNWGWVLAPGEVKAPVDPYIDELQTAAEEAASLCNAVNHMADQAGMAKANTVTDNPLAKLKVLKAKGFRAADVHCEGKDGASVQVSTPCPPLEGVSDSFTVSVSKTDGFKCMAPNFLGLDSDDRSDCIMWKGSGKELRVVYEIERTADDGRAKVIVELAAP